MGNWSIRRRRIVVDWSMKIESRGGRRSDVGKYAATPVDLDARPRNLRRPTTPRQILIGLHITSCTLLDVALYGTA